MSKSSVKRILTLCVCAVMVLSIFAFPKTAQAATYFKPLQYGSIVKSGSYYFKLDDGTISYCTTKNGTYKKAGYLGSVSSACTDGNIIYAVENRDEGFLRLARYTISTKGLKTLRKLSYGTYSYEPAAWAVTAVYGNAIFLTRGSFEEWSLKTFVYNTSTGVWKCKMKNCDIVFRSSKYLIARNEYQTDVSAHKWTLYQTNSSGDMTRLKTFGKYIGGAKFVGDYIYYAKYSDSTMRKLTICRCDKNGANGVNLGTVSFGTSSGDMVVVTEYYSSYCKLYHNGTYYKYTYSTKKLTAL